MSENLRMQLAQAQAKLSLIAAVDGIRDEAREPGTMFSALVNLIADTFDGGLCLLALVDRELGHLEMKAVRDRANLMKRLGSERVEALASRALQADHVEVWSDEIPDVAIAAMPIIMGMQLRLGCMLIVRENQPFSPTETDLLRLAENHIDSAILQGYDYYELKLRNLEIETIYRVDRIRDTNQSLESMLNAVLDEIRSVIPAEMGFVMLVEDDTLSIRAVSHDDLFRLTPYQDAIIGYGYEALEKAHMVLYNAIDGDLNSVMCIPLILRNEVIGIFGLANRYRAGGFEESDQRLMTAIASQMDTAIFEGLEQRRLRNVLGRAVDPQVMDRILENRDVAFLNGERMTLTVLYADMRDSTALAETTDPELLVGFINDYLKRMSDLVLDHEGTIDKFVGDEVMALFGAPFPMADHALRAVRVGLMMQATHEAIMAEWQERGVDARPIGIGIATGELIAGEMGSPQRSDYTVLGPAANLGARLCNAAAGGQVLIAEATYELVKGDVVAERVTGLQLKGISPDTPIYAITGLR
ncbi:MAG: GAF domain-containing protein [Chloroflexi bacterium]|nr:GAF domain-containing protein [Chloroflexota bacterium]